MPGPEPVAPPAGADTFVGGKGPGAQLAGGTRITENGRRSGKRVVGDAVEHDRARVEDGPSGVRGEQVSGPLNDLGVAGAEGRLQHALERQQPVHVARQLVQNASVERAHESAGTFGLPGGEPEEAGLGAHDGNSLGGRELLAFGRDDGARGRVTGLHGGVALHGLDHHPGVGEAGPFGRRDGQLDQPGRGVGAPAQQVEHQPPRRREELRARRFIAQPLEGAHVPVDGLDVQ